MLHLNKTGSLHPVTSFIKLSHGHFSPNNAKFSEHLSLKYHSQVILLMSKSEHMLDLTTYSCENCKCI